MNEHRRHDDPVARVRWVVIALVMLLPIAFGTGRLTSRPGPTVRAVEAKPVPRELPLGVDRFHDSSAAVTCWATQDSIRLNGDPTYGGISCLPDRLLSSATSAGGE